jgi:hypothetical protein
MHRQHTDEGEGLLVSLGRGELVQLRSSVFHQVDGGESVGGGVAKGTEEGAVCVLRRIQRREPVVWEERRYVHEGKAPSLLPRPQ